MKNWFKKKTKVEIEKVDNLSDEEDFDLKIRTSQDVGTRILALMAVIGKVHQGNDERFWNWLENNSIKSYLSDNEKHFIETDSPAHQQLANFSWRAEALVSLLWSIRILETMPALSEQFSVYSIEQLNFVTQNSMTFLNNIKLRPDSELEKMEEKLFHAHWQVRDAQLFRKTMPKELNPEVVYERRYALSWLIGWGDDWDNVPTDT